MLALLPAFSAKATSPWASSGVTLDMHQAFADSLGRAKPPKRRMDATLARPRASCTDKTEMRHDTTPDHYKLCGIRNECAPSRPTWVCDFILRDAAHSASVSLFVHHAPGTAAQRTMSLERSSSNIPCSFRTPCS